MHLCCVSINIQARSRSVFTVFVVDVSLSGPTWRDVPLFPSSFRCRLYKNGQEKQYEYKKIEAAIPTLNTIYLRMKLVFLLFQSRLEIKMNVLKEH